jgi:multiple sugar transport system substrate-binding protein
VNGRTTLNGLTWDHPRAYEGLDAETSRFNAMQDRIHLRWDRHSLRGFEATPITETAARYDLIILDHPFMGDAAAAGVLIDLNDHATALNLESLRTAFVGPSYESYAYRGGLWALPIDAACQIAVLRSNAKMPAPATMEDVRAIAAQAKIAIALACPHAFMNFLTICGLMGADISGTGDRLIPTDIGHKAIEVLRELAGLAPAEALNWSSIDALDAMAERDDLVYCPMVFCFSSYSRPRRSTSNATLQFVNLPDLGAERGPNGSVAGGTGLAVSQTCRHLAEAIEVVAHLISPDTQIRMALDGGQPAHRDAWNDSAADVANGGFFSACRRTMEGSIVRPRHAGYMKLQNAAGDLLRDDAVKPERSPRLVLGDIEALFRASLNYDSGR